MPNTMTPAAWKWLREACDRATIWPTYGPRARLLACGFIEPVGDGDYRITEAGRLALAARGV